MRVFKIEKTIELQNLSKVIISNELMGTKLEQSPDGAIHIKAELYLRMSDNSDEIIADDFITVDEKEETGTVSIEIEELDLDEDDYDLSHRSELTISVPAQVQISAETDNYFISAFRMDNNFEITNENGPIKIGECNGEVKITNENGPIKLFKVNGNLVIQEENGPVSADNLYGSKLEITSENGPIKMRECQFDDITIRNENGVIFYESLPVESGTITMENENGHINLALSPLQGFTLEATAELGQIKNSFMGQETTMFDNYKLEVGDQALKIKLTTENGMIKLSSSDMLGGDFFKGKLDYIKEMLKDSSEQGIKETHRIIGQLIASLTKMLEKVKEDAVKEKIEEALAQLKAWKAEINNPELKESLKETFDSISQEVGAAIQEALKATQEAMNAAKDKYHEEMKPHFEKHFGKGKDFFSHFKGFDGFRGFGVPPVPPAAPTPNREKEAMQDKARLKILEMLEAGKISSEEAEKLLKAIH
jgi:DUF4097 and DUF4098 domain-containing protein YvlB